MWKNLTLNAMEFETVHGIFIFCGFVFEKTQEVFILQIDWILCKSFQFIYSNSKQYRKITENIDNPNFKNLTIIFFKCNT